MKILVTGASGFIGKVLCSSLIQNGHEVIIIDNSAIQNLVLQSTFDSLPKVDTIIHLAAKSFIPDSFENPVSFYSNNFLSTLNILEKAKKDNSSVVFLSTYVYGVPEYLPIDESHPISPLNPYTESKVLCENLCNAYNRDFGTSITILRPFNVYGPMQNNNFFIPKVLSQLGGREIRLLDSRPKRDFIHVDDVVSAIQKTFVNHLNGTFKIYNLGTGKSTSVSEIVEIVLKYSKKKLDVIFSNESRQGEVLETVADISLIKNELNWNFNIDIDLGLYSILKQNHYNI